MMNSYNIGERKRVPIIMNWLGHERLRFVQTLTMKKKKCQTSSGLYNVLFKKCKPQHSETILSLQYCKMIIEEKESAEKGIGHL